MPYHHIKPATTNISIDLRTKCTLKYNPKNTIKVSDKFNSEEQPVNELNFKTHFGLIFALVSYFNLNNLELQFEYGFPSKSGLGGSGVLAVCTIAALNKLRTKLDSSYEALDNVQIASLAHHLEDGLRFSYTGFQDQCAAVFGGVNTWLWQYSNSPPFKQTKILDETEYKELQDLIVVAYTGESHNSSEVNELQVDGFFDSTTRHIWLRINEIAYEFADAIKDKNWEKAALLINEEHKLRCDLVPKRKSKVAQELEDLAFKNSKNGFAVSGAGNGGCVWALCSTKEDAIELKKTWSKHLESVPTGKILDFEIANKGLDIKSVPT